MSGINCLLWVGEGKAKPAKSYLIDALTSIEIQESSQGYSGFQLSFLLKKQMRGITVDYQGLTELKPFNRVVIGIKIGDTIPKYIIDGLITTQSLTENKSEVKLTVTGKDISLLFDKKEINIAHANIGDDKVVTRILSQYIKHGVIPNVKLPKIKADFGRKPQRDRHQAATDLEYIRKLAENNGYIFSIKPGPILPNFSIAYWGPKDKQGRINTPLSLEMGTTTSNVETMDFLYDGLKVEHIEGSYDDGKKLVALKTKAKKSSLARKSVSDELGSNVRRLLAKKFNYSSLKNAQDAINEKSANTSMDALSVQGSLDTSVYKDLLRAGYMVKVCGAGNQFNGFYYINQVTHSIAKGSYKQSFKLIRDSINAQ